MLNLYQEYEEITINEKWRRITDNNLISLADYRHQLYTEGLDRLISLFIKHNVILSGMYISKVLFDLLAGEDRLEVYLINSNKDRILRSLGEFGSNYVIEDNHIIIEGFPTPEGVMDIKLVSYSSLQEIIDANDPLSMKVLIAPGGQFFTTRRALYQLINRVVVVSETGTIPIIAQQYEDIGFQIVSDPNVTPFLLEDNPISSDIIIELHRDQISELERVIDSRYSVYHTPVSVSRYIPRTLVRLHNR